MTPPIGASGRSTRRRRQIDRFDPHISSSELIEELTLDTFGDANLSSRYEGDLDAYDANTDDPVFDGENSLKHPDGDPGAKEIASFDAFGGSYQSEELLRTTALSQGGVATRLFFSASDFNTFVQTSVRIDDDILRLRVDGNNVAGDDATLSEQEEYHLEGAIREDGFAVARICDPDGTVIAAVSDTLDASRADNPAVGISSSPATVHDNIRKESPTLPLITPFSYGEEQASNTVSFAWSGITSQGSKQVFAFNNRTDDVHVGVRDLDTDDLTIANTGFGTTSRDPHYSAAVGVDADGYLHLCWEMHGDPLNYAVSDQPLDPSSWTETSMTGSDEDNQTYPQFFNVDGKLYYSCRAGVDGRYQTLKSYDPETKEWTDVKSNWIDDSGNFAAYVDQIRVHEGVIHASWNWRDNDGDREHVDYCYIRSTDGGDTWEHADGSTLPSPITQEDVTPFDPGGNASNQNGLGIDGDGRPHVAWQKAPGGTDDNLQYYHSYYDDQGGWTTNQITDYEETPTTPTTPYTQEISRPNILVDRKDDGIIILGREGENSEITAFHSEIGSDEYTAEQLGSQTWGHTEFGPIDHNRWHSDGELSMLLDRMTTDNSNLYLIDETF